MSRRRRNNKRRGWKPKKPPDKEIQKPPVPPAKDLKIQGEIEKTQAFFGKYKKTVKATDFFQLCKSIRGLLKQLDLKGWADENLSLCDYHDWVDGRPGGSLPSLMVLFTYYKEENDGITIYYQMEGVEKTFKISTRVFTRFWLCFNTGMDYRDYFVRTLAFATRDTEMTITPDFLFKIETLVPKKKHGQAKNLAVVIPVLTDLNVKEKIQGVFIGGSADTVSTGQTLVATVQSLVSFGYKGKIVCIGPDEYDGVDYFGDENQFEVETIHGFWPLDLEKDKLNERFGFDGDPTFVVSDIFGDNGSESIKDIGELPSYKKVFTPSRKGVFKFIVYEHNSIIDVSLFSPKDSHQDNLRPGMRNLGGGTVLITEKGAVIKGMSHNLGPVNEVLLRTIFAGEVKIEYPPSDCEIVRRKIAEYYPPDSGVKWRMKGINPKNFPDGSVKFVSPFYTGGFCSLYQNVPEFEVAPCSQCGDYSCGAVRAWASRVNSDFADPVETFGFAIGTLLGKTCGPASFVKFSTIAQAIQTGAFRRRPYGAIKDFVIKKYRITRRYFDLVLLVLTTGGVVDLDAKMMSIDFDFPKTMELKGITVQADASGKYYLSPFDGFQTVREVATGVPVPSPLTTYLVMTKRKKWVSYLSDHKGVDMAIAWVKKKYGDYGTVFPPIQSPGVGNYTISINSYAKGVCIISNPEVPRDCFEATHSLVRKIERLNSSPIEIWRSENEDNALFSYHMGSYRSTSYGTITHYDRVRNKDKQELLGAITALGIPLTPEVADEIAAMPQKKVLRLLQQKSSISLKNGRLIYY